MKIERVHLNNFGSFFGDHEFKVSDRGLVFVSGDNQDEPRMNSNGSGKSTLFDAIDWCLFGKVPKDDHADSVINEEAGKDCWVNVSVYDPEADEIGLICRRRKPNKLQFEVGPPNKILQDKTAMDSDVTQAKIEEFLGLDRKVFHAAVYRAQGDEFDFANAKDSEKKALLSRIIPELQEIDQLKDIATKKLSVIAADILKKENRKTMLSNQIAVLNAKNWKEQEDVWKQHKAQRIKVATLDLDRVKSDLMDFDKVISGEESIRHKLEHQAAPPVQLTYKDREIYEAHTASATQLYGELAVALNASAFANTELQKINQIDEGPCSRCGQQVSGSHLEQERHRLLSEYQEKDQLRDQIETSYQQLMETGTFLKSSADAEEKRNQELLAAHQQEIGRLQGMLQNIENTKAAREKSEMTKLRLEGMIEVMGYETWPGEEQKAQDDLAKAEIEKELLEINSELKALDQKHALVSFWHKAFGLKGLKSFVLDSRLQDMTDAANEWVKILTGGTHWVRFESQTMTRSGKLSEAVNVRVFAHNSDGTVSDRNYKSYSGGEKKRIALGVDWGLSCLVASRASKKWDLYVVDESFRQHIDSGGRESIFELLEKLQKEESSIFVVDHDAEMASHFESSITIQRKGKRSVILEGNACQVAA